MKITLDSNPNDAPCCVKIIAEDGQDRLVQTDWDYPSVASAFGWNIRSVQKCDRCGKVNYGLTNCVVKYCRDCRENVGSVCDHRSTDGTVDCSCGLKPTDFIISARQWMDDNDGTQAEDPGYF